jgi:hypothetical protein
MGTRERAGGLRNNVVVVSARKASPKEDRQHEKAQKSSLVVGWLLFPIVNGTSFS